MNSVDQVRFEGSGGFGIEASQLIADIASEYQDVQIILAVLDGNHEKARQLAEQFRAPLRELAERMAENQEAA